MHRRVGSIRYGLAAAGLVAVLLSGCSSSNIGGSTFGNSKQTIAEISNIGDYDADRALSEARVHFRNNDFGYSAALYKRTVELSPKNIEGYIGLSASYDRIGRFDLSDRVYETFYKISGGSAQYYNNVGYSYMLRGNLSGALTNFRKAQKLDPDNVVIANNLQILSNAVNSARA